MIDKFYFWLLGQKKIKIIYRWQKVIKFYIQTKCIKTSSQDSFAISTLQETLDKTNTPPDYLNAGIDQNH